MRNTLTGRPVDIDPLPEDLVSDFFDHLREALEAASKLKRHKVYVDNHVVEVPDPTYEWFEARCKERLVKGAREYGNSNFLRPSVDLVEEAWQECMDLANYCLMESRKTRPDACAGVPLVSAAMHAVLAALEIKNYRDKLRGAP